MYNRKYHRKTVIIKQETDSFSKQNPLTAVATLELKNGRGKINIQGQSLGDNHAYLIAPRKGENKFVDIGQIGSVFDPDNVAGSGMTIEDFDVLVLGKQSPKGEFPWWSFVGYMDKKREWRRNIVTAIKEERQNAVDNIVTTEKKKLKLAVSEDKTLKIIDDKQKNKHLRLVSNNNQAMKVASAKPELKSVKNEEKSNGLNDKIVFKTISKEDLNSGELHEDFRKLVSSFAKEMKLADKKAGGTVLSLRERERLVVSAKQNIDPQPTPAGSTKATNRNRNIADTSKARREETTNSLSDVSIAQEQTGPRRTIVLPKARTTNQDFGTPINSGRRTQAQNLPETNVNEQVESTQRPSILVRDGGTITMPENRRVDSIIIDDENVNTREDRILNIQPENPVEIAPPIGTIPPETPVEIAPPIGTIPPETPVEIAPPIGTIPQRPPIPGIVQPVGDINIEDIPGQSTRIYLDEDVLNTISEEQRMEALNQRVWEIFQGNQIVVPFQEVESEWVDVTPQALWTLPINHDILRNRFFLYSYLRYNHILLGRFVDGSLMIGVPDYYDPTFRQEAMDLGFFDFVCENETRQTCQQEGSFGYWIKRIG